MNRRAFAGISGSVLGLLALGTGGAVHVLGKLNRAGNPFTGQHPGGSASTSSALFITHPALAAHVPRIPLAMLPTPV